MDIDLPTELDIIPEFEAKIAKKRPDAFVILQLIRSKDPDDLVKWETDLPSPSEADGGDDGGTQ